MDYTLKATTEQGGGCSNKCMSIAGREGLGHHPSHEGKLLKDHHWTGGGVITDGYKPLKSHQYTKGS